MERSTPTEKITINIQQQPRPPQQPRQSQPRQKRKSLQPRQGLLQGNSHSVQSVTSSVLQENKRLQQLAKKTKLQKKIDDLNIGSNSAEILKNILSGLNRSPQTGPLKKQNSGDTASTVSSLGLQDARASRNRRKQKKQKQQKQIQNLTSNFQDLHISPKQQSTKQKSSLKQSIRSYDLSNLQHQNSGHKKSQSRQTSSHISDPLYGFNQSNLPVDLGQEIQKILSKKQRKQG